MLDIYTYYQNNKEFTKGPFLVPHAWCTVQMPT